MNCRNYCESINYEYPRTCIFLLTYCHNDAQNAQPLHFLYIYKTIHDVVYLINVKIIKTLTIKSAG